MRIGFSRCSLVGLALWSALSLGCKDKKPDKVTHEDCVKAAEHVADLIMANFEAQPSYWWDSVHNESALDPGLPKEVTKETFVAWLKTPEGQTWKALRRGQTLAGVQQGVEPCMKSATKAQVKCLLAAKSRGDVLACDDKAEGIPTPVRGPVAIPGGSAATNAPPVGSGSAQ